MSETDESKMYEHNFAIEEHQRNNFEQPQRYQNYGSGQLRFTPTPLLSLDPSADLLEEKDTAIANHVKCHNPLSDIILGSMSNGGGTSSSTATASVTNSDSGLYYPTIYC